MQFSLDVCANQLFLPNELNCVSLFHDFRVKEARSLIARRVKTEDPLSTFSVEGYLIRGEKIMPASPLLSY